MAIGMAVKMTFTLDDATVQRINGMAARLAKPKSEVVREAVRDYYEKGDRMSESERLRKLKVLADLMKRPQTRTQAEADRELREIRRSRREGWGRPSDRR